MTEIETPLPPALYDRPVLEVARALVGCRLVRRFDGDVVSGRIVEVEAYGGRCDASAHSFRGPTPRCQTMFGPSGHAYVYFSYGAHWCMNVTAGPRDFATAVLLRAVEPEEGLDRLREHRAGASRSAARAAAFHAGRLDEELCNGPGKLTAAFGIDRSFDGRALVPESDLWIAPGRPVRHVVWTPRVGLGENPAAPWLWRCVAAESRGVTRVPGHWPRASRPSPTFAEVVRAAGSR